jgi:hypothetical protein
MFGHSTGSVLNSVGFTKSFRLGHALMTTNSIGAATEIDRFVDDTYGSLGSAVMKTAAVLSSSGTCAAMNGLERLAARVNAICPAV